MKLGQQKKKKMMIEERKLTWLVSLHEISFGKFNYKYLD